MTTPTQSLQQCYYPHCSDLSSTPVLSFPFLFPFYLFLHHLVETVLDELNQRWMSLFAGTVHLYALDGLGLNWHSSYLSLFCLLKEGHHIWPADIISMIFDRGLFTSQGALGHQTLVSQTVIMVAINKHTSKHTNITHITFLTLIQSLAVTQKTAWLTFQVLTGGLV